MKKPSWKRVSSGKYIDLNNFTEDDVDVFDINHSLNESIRFTGHWKNCPPLTVAQHTLLVVKLSEILFPDDKPVQLAALVHDWPEAYYGDIITPVKRILGKALTDFTDPIDAIVEKKFWTLEEKWDDEVSFKVKICDTLSLDIERRCMWSSQLGKDKWPPVNVDPLKLIEKEKLFFEVHGEYVDLEKLYDRCS